MSHGREIERALNDGSNGLHVLSSGKNLYHEMERFVGTSPTLPNYSIQSSIEASRTEQRRRERFRAILDAPLAQLE